MKLYTIGTSKKSAEDFFTLLVDSEINKLLDIRVNNNSQLLGFTKGRDLKYFCEKCFDIKYEHTLLLAPTQELIKSYRENRNWTVYEKDFMNILRSRPIKAFLGREFASSDRICLLCSEASADRCHRRLVAEHIASILKDIETIHL